MTRAGVALTAKPRESANASSRHTKSSCQRSTASTAPTLRTNSRNICPRRSASLTYAGKGGSVGLLLACTSPRSAPVQESTRPIDPAVVFDLTFPYDHRAPSESPQLARFPSIPNPIRNGLRVPIIGVRRRAMHSVLATVRVPEASVHEYCSFASRKCQVGPPRKVLRMQRVSVAQCVKLPTNGHFRGRILLAYPSHQLAAPTPSGIVTQLRHSIRPR